MEHVTDGLQLYLKMNELQGDKVPDSSGHDRHGKTTGKPTVVNDSVFGSCLRFSRDDGSVMIADASELRAKGDLTFSAWLRLTDDYSPGTTNAITIFKIPGLANSSSFELLFDASTTHQYVKSLYHSNYYCQSVARKGTYLDNNQWLHVTATVQEEKSTRRVWTWHYVHLRNKDGSLSLVSSGGTARQTPSLTGIDGHHSRLELVGQRYQLFNFSHVRYYNRALSQAEIEKNLAADLGIESIAPKEPEPEAETKPAPLSAFRAEYPIDIKLYDDDHQAALYIDDGHQHQFNLELHNRSGRNITFNAASDDKASALNHHLELKFRPGTLSTKTLLALKNAQLTVLEKSWELSNGQSMSGANIWSISASDSKSGVPVSVYLLCKGDRNRVLGADCRCVLSLLPMAAAAQQGARGTQVTLKFNQMTYAGPDRLAVTGQRTRQLYVTHAGRRDLPVHIGFIGSNQIHTDSNTSELTLRITNTHRSSAIAGSQWGGHPKFILRFDYGEDVWALCKPGEVAGSIEVQTQDVIPPDGQRTSPEWIIPMPSEGIAPGKHKEIKIIFKGVTTRGRGNTNLYLGYENIPGYADGQIISTLERSPMSVTQSGINIKGELSAATLKVTDELSAKTINVTGDFTASILKANNKVIASSAEIDGPISTGDGAIRWKLLEGELPRYNPSAEITIELKDVPDSEQIVSISGNVSCNVSYHSSINTPGHWREQGYEGSLTLFYPINPGRIQQDDNPVQLVYSDNAEASNKNYGPYLYFNRRKWELKFNNKIFKKIISTGNFIMVPRVETRKYKLLIMYTDKAS